VASRVPPAVFALIIWPVGGISHHKSHPVVVSEQSLRAGVPPKWASNVSLVPLHRSAIYPHRLSIHLPTKSAPGPLGLKCPSPGTSIVSSYSYISLTDGSCQIPGLRVCLSTPAYFRNISFFNLHVGKNFNFCNRASLQTNKILLRDQRAWSPVAWITPLVGNSKISDPGRLGVKKNGAR
jgi:hypothetical protein